LFGASPVSSAEIDVAISFLFFLSGLIYGLFAR